MKRIIELSENDYKDLKEEGVQNHIALADTVIARSVPVSTDSDLISRSELIKALNEAQVEFDEYYKGLGKAKVITDNATVISPALPTEVKKALEVLKVMKQGRWIPVSEKLPPNYILCLFCTTDEDIFYGFRNSENLWREKGSTENISNVVAWQELPEPYKRGKKNETDN